MKSIFRRMAVAGLVLALPAVSHAQLLVSTGASVTAGLDNRWQFTATPNAATPTWTAATIVTGIPGQWSGGAPGGTWISGNASASGNGGNYGIRTLFSLSSGDALSFSFRCAADNGPVSLWINGAVVGENPCPQLWNWGSFITLTQSAFQLGQNTLEFRWTGDNATDGMAVQIDGLDFTPGAPGDPNVVPEPATVVLMASGLFGLGLVARRRRVR